MRTSNRLDDLLWRACLALGVVASASGHSVESRAPRQSVQAPVFRSGTDIVRLDVSALDSDRRPVRGLTASDFLVLENDVERPVVHVEAIEIAEAPVAAANWIRAVASDVATNEAEQGRVWVMVIDDATAQMDVWALQAVKRVAKDVVGRLDPADRMAVVFTRDNRNAQDFTNSRDRLIRAIDTFTIGFKGMRGAGDNYWDWSAIRTLEAAADFLATAPDRRRAIVYVGFGVDVKFIQPPTWNRGSAVTEDIQHSLLERTKRLIERARLAGVSVYMVDACGLRVGNPLRACTGSTEFMETVANASGGRAVLHTNDFTPGITQIYRENSSYYIVSYRLPEPPKPGDYRRVAVKVNRPGVEVRTRAGYYVDEGNALTQPKVPASPATKALTGILPASGLRLRGSATAVAVPGQREARVVLAISAVVPVPAVSGATTVQETIDLDTRAFTAEGAPRGSFRQSASLRLRPGVRDRATIEMLTSIALRPGRYNIRVGASAKVSAASGGVYMDVDVPDFASAPLSLTGPVLAAEPRAQIAGREAVESLLPLAPTAERTFSRGQEVRMLLRIHQGTRGSLAPISVRRRIVDQDDRPVIDESLTIEVDRFVGTRTADVDWRNLSARLPPGHYLVTCEVGKGKTILSRQIPIRIE